MIGLLGTMFNYSLVGVYQCYCHLKMCYLLLSVLKNVVGGKKNSVCYFTTMFKCVMTMYIMADTTLQDHNWAFMRENLSLAVCEQHRRRPACASTQSDQRLHYSLIRKYHI